MNDFEVEFRKNESAELWEKYAFSLSLVTTTLLKIVTTDQQVHFLQKLTLFKKYTLNVDNEGSFLKLNSHRIDIKKITLLSIKVY